ncbi:hypothetical protein DL769_001456 [Monosporascus sp. CRB-8-3]|nr:hypothetical protein DL769_001456 [Monosporascus sp. CRB-8-3]
MVSRESAASANPRMLDHIFKGALASGFLQAALDWTSFHQWCRTATDQPATTRRASSGTWPEQRTPRLRVVSGLLRGPRPHQLADELARAVGLLMRERFCDEAGVADPPGFHICRACYLEAAEPPGLTCFFKPRTSTPSSSPGDGKDETFPPPNTTVLCCFNPAHPRLQKGFLPVW